MMLVKGAPGVNSLCGTCRTFNRICYKHIKNSWGTEYPARRNRAGVCRIAAGQTEGINGLLIPLMLVWALLRHLSNWKDVSRSQSGIKNPLSCIFQHFIWNILTVNIRKSWTLYSYSTFLYSRRSPQAAHHPLFPRGATGWTKMIVLLVHRTV